MLGSLATLDSLGALRCQAMLGSLATLDSLGALRCQAMLGSLATLGGDDMLDVASRREVIAR
jgi:hypothetical protein